MLSYWDFGRFHYVERFAVCPGMRNRGYGRKGARNAAEPTAHARRARSGTPRQRACGATHSVLPPQRIHAVGERLRTAAYRPGDDAVPMRLMVCGALCETDDFASVKETIHRGYTAVRRPRADSRPDRRFGCRRGMAPWSAATNHGAEDSRTCTADSSANFPAFRFVPERSSRIVVPNASSRQNRTSPASAPGLSYFTNSRSAKRKRSLLLPSLFVSLSSCKHKRHRDHGIRTVHIHRPDRHHSRCGDHVLDLPYHQRYERPYIIHGHHRHLPAVGGGQTLNMELLSSILGQFISVGVIALIIVFNPSCAASSR